VADKSGITFDQVKSLPLVLVMLSTTR
jgi:hypothetical protein